MKLSREEILSMIAKADRMIEFYEEAREELYRLYDELEENDED